MVNVNAKLCTYMNMAHIWIRTYGSATSIYVISHVAAELLFSIGRNKKINFGEHLKWMMMMMRMTSF